MDYTDLLNEEDSQPDIPSLVAQAADKYGIPRSVALAVAEHESDFNQDALSPSGAIGVMQLMPTTAQGLGVDPHNLMQNIDGGVRYLAAAYKRFGPEGGIAAYQAGPGAVARNGGKPVDASDGLSTNSEYVSKVQELAQKYADQDEKGDGSPPFDYTALLNGAAASGQTAQDSRLQAAIKQSATDVQNAQSPLTRLAEHAAIGGTSVLQFVGNAVGYATEKLNEMAGTSEPSFYGLGDKANQWKKELSERLMQDPTARNAAKDVQNAQGFWQTLGAMSQHPVDEMVGPVAEMVLPFIVSIPFAEIGGAIGAAGAASKVGTLIGRTMNMAPETAQALGSGVGATVAASLEQGAQGAATAYNDVQDALMKNMPAEQAHRQALAAATQVGIWTSLFAMPAGGMAAARLVTDGLDVIRKQTLKSAAANIGMATGSSGAGNVMQARAEANATGQDYDAGKAFAQGSLPGFLLGAAGEGRAAMRNMGKSDALPTIEETPETPAPTDVFTPVNTDDILKQLDNAPDVNSAIGLVNSWMAGRKVDLGESLSVDAMPKMDVLQQAGDSGVMHDMLSGLSEETRQKLLQAFNTATSKADIGPGVRNEAIDTVFNHLQDNGGLDLLQQRLNEQRLAGTPEEKASISDAGDLLNKPEWQQFAQNQNDQMRAAIDTSAGILNDTTLPETQRAAAGRMLTDLAKRKMTTQEDVQTPEEQPAVDIEKNFADNRDTVTQIVQDPRWGKLLDSLPKDQHADVIDQMRVIGDPRISTGYRNNVAASVIERAREAGIDVPQVQKSAPAVPEATGVSNRPGDGQVRDILSKSNFQKYGTVTLSDPSRFTKSNLMAVASGGISSGQARMLQVLGRALGRDVRFFDQSGGQKHLDGFVHASVPDTIFLNRNQSGSASAMAIFGHEFLHSMAPDIKGRFIEAVSKQIDPAKADQLRQYMNQPSISQPRLLEEASADLFGNGFNKPELISRAMDDMPPSIAVRVVQHVRDFVSNLIGKLKGLKDFDTGKFISDAQSIEDAWVSALRDHINRVNRGEAHIEGRPAHDFTMEELSRIMETEDHPGAERADAEIGRRSSYPDYEAVEALAKVAGKKTWSGWPIVPEREPGKPLEVPLKDMVSAQLDARRRRDKGELLNPVELDLANAPDIEPNKNAEIATGEEVTPNPEAKIERRLKDREPASKEPIEVVEKQKKGNPDATLTDADKEEIQKELEQEQANLPEEYPVNEEMPMQLSSERPRILFEVAPDPNNKELSDRWNAIPTARKTSISEHIASSIIPRLLKTVGAKGEMRPQLGGYKGETNPSFSIKMAANSTPEQIERAAKVAGYALSQDSMMVVSPKKVGGADPVGIITVHLPKDASPELVSDVYKRLYEIDNGVLEGHTTVDGKMAIIDFSGRTKELGRKVFDKLAGTYPVDVDSGYAAFIGKDAYNYEAQADNSSTGPEAASGSPLRDAANRFRAEASDALERELGEGTSFSVNRKELESTWDTPAMKQADDVRYLLQDKQIDTKRVVEAIKKASGNIADKLDAYLKETLYHGRVSEQTKGFLDYEMKPLLQSMTANKVSIADLNEYLHNRHAEERNLEMARRNPSMQDKGSGIATADARAYLSKLPADKKRVLDGLAKRVDAITKGTRSILVASGLETPETVAAWEQAYKNYVPLKREGHKEGLGIGQGFSVRGPSSKHAMGSESPVADILANVALAREKAITRAEKNRVSQALYGLAVQNPNPDFWLPVASAKDVNGQADMLTRMGLDPEDVKNLVNEPPQRVLNPTTGEVEYRVNPLLRNADNVVATRVNGKDQFLFFNENDARAGRMVKSLKNLDTESLGQFLAYSGKLTRYIASINTQYNPFFGVLNIARDTGEAMLNLSTTEIAGHQRDVLKNIPSAVRGVYLALREERAGQPTTSKWAQLFKEFSEAGGKTGYRDMYTSTADRAEAIRREIEAMQSGKVKQAGRAVMEWLSDYNDALENGTRLAAYKVARDNGMSVERAAALAKELTVNFNRKGKVAPQMGALYAFFNANVQGMSRMAETMSGPMGRKILVGGLLAGAMNYYGMKAAGIEDDVPEFVKENNFIIPTGGKTYIAIPMPLGYRIIPSISRIALEYFDGGMKNGAKHTSDMLGLLADTFNPIGNAGISMQTISPTFLDPIAALAENKDWTGRPIAKKDYDTLNPTPGFTRSFANASAIGKTVAQAINTLSGGSKYRPGLVSLTPDQIDYLIAQATGGVGREALKFSQLGQSAVSGEEMPTSRIPLIGRFYGNASDKQNVSSQFYENVQKLNELQNEGKARLKARDDYMGFVRDNPEVKYAGQADSAMREVSALKKTKEKLIDSGADKSRVRAIDQRISAIMDRLNQRVAQ